MKSSGRPDPRRSSDSVERTAYEGYWPRTTRRKGTTGILTQDRPFSYEPLARERPTDAQRGRAVVSKRGEMVGTLSSPRKKVSAMIGNLK